jgi:hypothetical protein
MRSIRSSRLILTAVVFIAVIVVGAIRANGQLNADLPAAIQNAIPDLPSPTVAPPYTMDPALGAGPSASPSAHPNGSPVPTASIDSGRAPSASPGTAATAGLVPGSVNATSIDLTAEYQATVMLNFATRSFQATSTMTVTNTSGKAIDRLELNTVAARLGQMTLTLARVEGIPVHATVSDQTIHLPLGGILEPGAVTTVRIGYRATLRGDTAGSDWLFTRANGILEAHRWLPWISIPTAFDRPNHGDPFVTPVSPRVRVTIVSDRAIRWATTGEQTSPTGRTTSFEARNVRDFVFAGAPDYKTVSANVGGVLVHVWYRPGFPAATVLAAAKTALTREAALLGAYPYGTYDVAQTAGGYGMEAPGLTFIPTGAANLGYLVAHETAHQWFYGIVGNDQARQPFADEAATDFVARNVLGLRRGSRCATARLDLTIYRYSAACYYEDIYIQGGNVLDDTRKAMGSSVFWAGIRDYLATYRFKIGGTRALLDTLDGHTTLDLAARLRSRFPSLL